MSGVMRVQLTLLALVVSSLIPFLHYPYSLVLAFASAVLLFASMGRVSIVLGSLISGLIILTPVAFEYGVIDVPWGGFVKPRGSIDEIVPYDFTRLSEEGHFKDVKSLEILGIGVNVILSKEATMMSVEEGLYYKFDSEKLSIFSKSGGNVIGPPVERIEVEGMGVRIKGYGKRLKIRLGGMKNEVDLDVTRSFDVEITGMSNSVQLNAKSTGDVEVYGLGNEVKIDLTGASPPGTVRVEVNGTGNRVNIYVPKNGRVSVVKEVNPDFMNEVRVIRR